jgi:hypothetical protein
VKKIRIVLTVRKLRELKYIVHVGINATDCAKASFGISDVVLQYLKMKEQSLFNNVEVHRKLNLMEILQKCTHNA